ncbi:MAG TPA: hypothetical protein PL151_02500 [Phycisphaerae bacterium]|nr:hypothetical protein [Phycisphaerae bacterium]HOJ74376.1 hypothetical protein [Phycisphaerae bacterium]HOM53000.1 hypothetical protein [Phycisphaerae bacterium]HON65995.1 hypothetical protein [Phycisphaerae bacterium]HOQ85786.1 hypothetical protein [Phycisphaerae bacterium]
MASVLWKLCVLAGVIGGAAWWTAASTTPVKMASPVPAIAPAPRQPLLSPDDPYHGVAWQIHRAEGSVEEARLLLGQIADLGADAVLISNAGYQEHAGSESFKIDPEVTPSPEQWEQIFKIAHDNGLRVIFMPIILLSNPRGTEWRGVINPPNWDDWLEQYREFLLYFARIAAKSDVEVFMVGSELISAEKNVHVDKWRELIRDVRKVFPGKLSYSSNWDHYKVVEFWDELDLIGMTSYYKLSNQPNPSLESLIEAWKPIRRGLLRWQQTIGKPLLFTEVGWCSQEGASIEPWNYYRYQTPTAAGHEEQARCYRAFMETWKDDIGKGRESPVGGVIWWEWMNVPGGPEDFNYIPKGKPAELELRNWFSRIRQIRTNLAQTAE